MVRPTESRQVKRTGKKAGASPGTVVHVGLRRETPPRLTILDYSKDQHTEREVGTAQDCFRFRDSATISWINIDGLHDTGLISELGSYFGIHSLVLEDIVNTTQRPKIEAFDGYIFICLKMLSLSESGALASEQVSLICGKGFVLSFQEGLEGDVFGAVRERIRSGKGRIRTMGSDYLTYALIDSIVDNYFVVVERFGEDLEELEEALSANPSEKILSRIHRTKRSSIEVRRSIWPLRELVSSLERNDSGLVSQAVAPYLRDVYGHVVEVIDVLEAHREMLSGMLEIYLSSISNRLNRVMMVLTLVTTIFMPLSFIAAVYGMNFRFMPELEWRFGYPLVLLLMALIAGGMMWQFRKRHWI